MAGPSALCRLISVDAAEFAERYWDSSALLSPADTLPRDFTDLLDEAAVDELVTCRGLRTPFLRVAKNGSTLSNRAFTAPGGVGATIDDQVSDDKLVRLFADGSTMVLQALHRVWPPIIDFCRDLAAELGHPVQANAYVTPPAESGVQPPLRRARRLRAADSPARRSGRFTRRCTRRHCEISRGRTTARPSSKRVETAADPDGAAAG